MKLRFNKGRQMEALEKTGKTVEEAIEKALDELGVDHEDVEIVVVDRGRGGILGLGAGEARVRVTLKEELGPMADDDLEDVDTIDAAKEAIENLLRGMAVDASVGLPQRSGGKRGEAAGNTTFNIDGEDAGLLIGRRGETLSAMQFIVNFILSRRAEDRVGVSIDVEGYRERRYEQLRSLATRMAERVSSSGRTINLEPMPARERRIIHMALSGNPRVTTESVGERGERQVTIVPKRGARRRGPARGRFAEDRPPAG